MFVENCSTCDYWDCEAVEPYSAGLCRYKPPKIVVHFKDNEYVTLWPTTEETDWCGSWKKSLHD